MVNVARKGKGKEARKRMPLSVRALGKIVAAAEIGLRWNRFWISLLGCLGCLRERSAGLLSTAARTMDHPDVAQTRCNRSAKRTVYVVACYAVVAGLSFVLSFVNPQVCRSSEGPVTRQGGSTDSSVQVREARGRSCDVWEMCGTGRGVRVGCVVAVIDACVSRSEGVCNPDTI